MKDPRVFSFPAHLAGRPCFAGRFALRKPHTEAELMKLVAPTLNPPAPGLVFCAVARTSVPGEYIEIEVYECLATLLHSIQRFEAMQEIVAGINQIATCSAGWTGTVESLPDDIAPPWLSLTSPSGTQRADEPFHVSPAQRLPSVAEPTEGPDTTATAATSLCCDPHSMRAEGTSSVVSDSILDSTDPDPPRHGGLFHRRYWRVVVPHEPPRACDAALSKLPSVMVVAEPHTYELESIRFAMAQPLTTATPAAAPRPYRVYQHRPLRAVPRESQEVMANEADALQRVVDMCLANGWPVASTTSDPAAEVAAPPRSGLHHLEALPPQRRPPRPLCMLVEFPTGPKRRCYADTVGGAFGASMVRLPKASLVGCQVVVRAGNGDDRLRIGHVASVSAWCKRKSLRSTSAADPVFFVERLASNLDLHNDVTVVQACARDCAAAAVRSIDRWALPLSLQDAWCSLDLSAVTLVIRAVSGDAKTEARRALVTLEHALVAHLAESSWRAGMAAAAPRVHVMPQFDESG